MDMPDVSIEPRRYGSRPANFKTALVYDWLGALLPLLAPGGRRSPQACKAERNCGEFGLTPCGTGQLDPFDETEMAESGKFGTPWERTQASEGDGALLSRRERKSPAQEAPPAGFETATCRLEDVRTEFAQVHRCRPSRLDQGFHRGRNR